MFNSLTNNDMSKLSWGKPTIRHKESENGAPKSTGDWESLDTPKQDTTELTTTAGDEVTANEEGGAIVDVRFGASTYELAFDLFEKKGSTTDPFTDVDGVIAGEHALQIIPEDSACKGIQIDRCALRREIAYTAADGILYHYVARCLKPASGNTIKPLVISTGSGS